jgi:hypothetical protein
MRYSEIMESADTDISSVQKAGKISSAFCKYLVDHNADTPLKDVPGMILQDTIKGNYWFIDAHKVCPDLMETSDTLYIGFLHSLSNKAEAVFSGVGKPSERRGICVFVVKNDPADQTDMAYKVVWDNLVHELTHFFDQQRFKDSEKWASSSVRGKTNPRGYYNSPKEMNAFFAQGLSEIVTKVMFMAKLGNSKHGRDLLKTLDSFESFSNAYESAFRSDWLNALTGDNQKKFKKRLYKIYIYIKKNFPNIDKESIADIDSN